MEETHDQQKLHGFLQCAIYGSLILEAAIFIYHHAPFWGVFVSVLDKIGKLPMYSSLIYSKLSTLVLICLVSIGTLAKKNTELDPKTQIVYPLAVGFLLFFGSMMCFGRASPNVFAFTTQYDLAYMLSSLIGALLISLSMDNISKIIRSGLGKDKWNTEAESFMQPVKCIETPYSV